jgi:hypothetical protein
MKTTLITLPGLLALSIGSVLWAAGASPSGEDPGVRGPAAATSPTTPAIRMAPYRVRADVPAPLSIIEPRISLPVIISDDGERSN